VSRHTKSARSFRGIERQCLLELGESEDILVGCERGDLIKALRIVSRRIERPP
jgi:hypothetical protein